MSDLTRTQMEVLRGLAAQPKRWWSPTELAHFLYPMSSRHSAYTSPKLKALVARGYAERRKPGHYRITDAGMNVAEGTP